MLFTPLPEGFVLRENEHGYKIVRLLGKGGMGAVYAAKDNLRNKQVAIKQNLHHQLIGSPEEINEDFKREAQLLAQLEHSAFPKVIDYFIESHFGAVSQYLVMDYIQGDNLSCRFDENDGKGRPLSLLEAFDIAEQLLLALEALHSYDIFHRDLKPANLIVLRDGKLKVLDLGAAKGSVGNMTQKKDSIQVYTREYASPEQIHGYGTNARSDLFSIGATLYHLLAGELAPNAEKRGYIINQKKQPDPLRPLYELNPKVPASVSEVIIQALSLDPEDRPESAAKMLRLLHLAFKVYKPGDENPDNPAQVPARHLYLRKSEIAGAHELQRERDNQVVLWLPAAGKAQKSFLIDKYLVTNEQFAHFLNDPEVKAQTSIVYENNFLKVIAAQSGQVLLGDAESHWQSEELNGSPWGLTYKDGSWKPLSGSEKFPVTWVTVFGAGWYACWARYIPFRESRKGNGLASEAEWETAALWNYHSGILQPFPWGDSWDFSKLNHIGYWAQEDLEMDEAEFEFWRKKVRPTPVGLFTQGCSLSGLTDALGNVWEWLNEQDQSGRQMIKGGACTSQKSVFLRNFSYYRQDNFISPVIGFRCSWQLPTAEV